MKGLLLGMKRPRVGVDVFVLESVEIPKWDPQTSGVSGRVFTSSWSESMTVVFRGDKGERTRSGQETDPSVRFLRVVIVTTLLNGTLLLWVWFL